MHRLGSLAIALLAVACVGSEPESAVTTSNATQPELPAAPPIADGSYDGHMRGEFDGSLTIENVDDRTLHFAFEISLDEDVSPVGRLSGTATRTTTTDGQLTYRYVDGGCVIDLQPETHGDLMVNPTLTCGLLVLDRKVDFAATWVRAR